jgi:hypothetical protein
VVKGLEANDQVIVDGLQNASPGNKVQIKGQQNANGRPITKGK